LINLSQSRHIGTVVQTGITKLWHLVESQREAAISDKTFKLVAV